MIGGEEMRSLVFPFAFRYKRFFTSSRFVLKQNLDFASSFTDQRDEISC
jgi:hypothetical protein